MAFFLAAGSMMTRSSGGVNNGTRVGLAGVFNGTETIMPRAAGGHESPLASQRHTVFRHTSIRHSGSIHRVRATSSHRFSRKSPVSRRKSP